MKIKNPFEIKKEASRYERYRPKYHHVVFEHIQKTVGGNFSSSLDVACGTGHSTVALAKISEKTVGCDLSESMLFEARRNEGIEFIQADANDLPFDDNLFDCVSISMGFHWVDQGKFLKEVKRVLKSGGYFNVDNYGFFGKISENPEKQKLHSDLFETYLPPASRRSAYPTEELVKPLDFELISEFKSDHKINLNAEEFINLLMTWSNFQVLSEAQKEIASQKMWEVYERIFESDKLSLGFGGKAVLYRMGKG